MFAHGRTNDLLQHNFVAQALAEGDKDWRYYYVGMQVCRNIPTRFVDHDMIMQFHGGGVGHKSTRNATDQLLDDRDHGKESA